MTLFSKMLRIDSSAAITHQEMQVRLHKIKQDYSPVAVYYSTLLWQLFRGYEYSIASLAQDISDILMDDDVDVQDGEVKEKKPEEGEPSMARQVAVVFATREFTDIPAWVHVEALVCSLFINLKKYWVVQALLETRDFRNYVDDIQNRLVDMKKEKTVRATRMKKIENERKKLTSSLKVLETKEDALHVQLMGEADPIIDEAAPSTVDVNTPVDDGEQAKDAIVIDGDKSNVVKEVETPIAIVESEPVNEIDERMTDRQKKRVRRASLELEQDGIKNEISDVQTQLLELKGEVSILDKESSSLQIEEDNCVEEGERINRQTVIQGTISSLIKTR
jgi:predicted  nucleic acid-binding Zn-ribbon protein